MVFCCVFSALYWIFVTILGLLIVLLLSLKFNKHWQEWFFAHVVFGYFLEGVNWADHIRNSCLKHLTEIIEEKSKETKHIRLLEIGPGTGANFKFMEPGNDYTKVHISVVDPNQKFEKRFKDKLEMYPNLRMEKWFAVGAEELDKVCEEGSFDIVVSTHILCSVSDLDKSIRQIRRVLAPGGKAFFMEHVIDSPDRPLVRLLQTIACPFWEIIFCGCQTTRDTEKAIRDVEFSEYNISSAYAPQMPLFVRRHIYGYVTK